MFRSLYTFVLRVNFHTDNIAQTYILCAVLGTVPPCPNYFHCFFVGRVGWRFTITTRHHCLCPGIHRKHSLGHLHRPSCEVTQLFHLRCLNLVFPGRERPGVMSLQLFTHLLQGHTPWIPWKYAQWIFVE